MTERLYYDDGYCRDFDASVVRVEPRGGRCAVWLDRTAFYPTSGGQPFDTGTLGAARVVEVTDGGDDGDDVVHLIEGPADLLVGQTVRGSIDWHRRFDHMQHHTGQHLLSAAIARRFRVLTLSFHLGKESATIDIARELSVRELAAAEDDANDVVWENRTVTVRYAGTEEARTLGLRKASQREGTLRIVEIDDFDLSACGGSHVRQTGAIGAVVVRSWERFKGGQRIEFLCGGRAVVAHRQLRDVVGAGVRLLSVLPSELPGAVERLQTELRQKQRDVDILRAELAIHQASAMAATAESMGSARWVFEVVDGDAHVLKTLAQAVVTRPGLMAVLTSTASPALLIVARSADVTLPCDEAVRVLAAAFGGRGGGRPDLAQAGKLDAIPDAILARARALAVEWSTMDGRGRVL